MAEGGFLPWKLSRNRMDAKVKYVDYSKLRQPLPKPPTGYHWTRSDGTQSGGEKAWGLLNEATGEILPSLPPPEEGVSAPAAPKAVVAVPVDVPEYLEVLLANLHKEQAACC